MDPLITPAHLIDTQLAAVHQLRWYPDEISIDDDTVSLSGWALGLWDGQDQRRFLVNGTDFEHVEWPLPSPDLLSHFKDVPNASASRFRCSQSRRGGAWPFEDGFARFNVTSRFGEHGHAWRTAWHLADPSREGPLPSEAQIARVIGVADRQAFRLGGATLACRLDTYLRQRFGRPVASFESVLDWGCGAGRLTRYLTGLSPHVTGIDIDADNIAMCARLIPSARFLPVGLHPPTPFPDGSFDLVCGISVLTHLDEANQHDWLRELQRIVRPGGLLLLSVMGQAQACLYREWDTQLLTARKGISVMSANPQLREVLADPDYYQDVRHSHDYIMATWADYFEVVDIVPAIGCPQDIVALHRRTPA